MVCIKIESIANSRSLVIDFNGHKIDDQSTDNLPLLLSLARCDLLSTRGTIFRYFVHANCDVSAYWCVIGLRGLDNTRCV